MVGSGRGGGAGDPALAPRRLSAPPTQPLPFLPWAAASTSAPLSPRRRTLHGVECRATATSHPVATRRWTWPSGRSTRRSSSSWRTPPPTSQRRSAAPRRTPHPAAPPLRRVRPMRVAASLAVASQHSRALSPYHSSPSTPYLNMGTQYIYICPAHLPLSGPLLPQPHAQTTLLIHRKYRQRKYGHSEYSQSEYTLTRV